jgi:hypothetical protein
VIASASSQQAALTEGFQVAFLGAAAFVFAAGIAGALLMPRVQTQQEVVPQVA